MRDMVPKQARRGGPRVDSGSLELDGVGFGYIVLPASPLADHSALTRAERAVVDGVLRGWSNAEIASSRGASVRTVANQLAKVFIKLGVRSRHEIVRELSTESSR